MPPTVTTNDTLGDARRDAMMITSVAMKKKHSVKDKIFKKLSTTQKYEQFDTVSGFGYPSQQGQGAPVSTDARRKLYSGQITPVVYSLAYEVTELYEYTGQWPEIKNNQPQVAKSMHAGRELHGANIFNFAWNTGSAYLGFDSKPLLATDHPTKGGPTFANTSSTSTGIAWSYEGYKNSVTNLKAMVDPRNLPFDFAEDQGYYILHAENISLDVDAVLSSQKNPDNANNESNPLYRSGTPLEWRYLSSATAYFVIPVDKSHGLKWLQQMPLAVKTFDDGANTGNMRVRTRESYKAFWDHAYGIWGDLGA